METQLIISDQTLRDGEQQVGIVFSSNEKIELACDLAKAGVDSIALMPGICSEEFEIAHTLISRGLPLIPDVPVKIEYINEVQILGAKHITLFAPTSNIMLSARGISPNENLKTVQEFARYANQQGLIVDFALEDASRTDIGYIIEVAQALKNYVNVLILCDTVGCLQPNLTKMLVQTVIRHTDMKIGIHCHNDLGLAVDNTISAVLSGAVMISGTMMGIGERAGNAALEQVLERLENHYQFRFEKIDRELLRNVCRKVNQLVKTTAAKPLTKEAFYTQTGIHVNVMLQNPAAYTIFPGILPEIWFGKYSGTSNFKWLFERVCNHPLSENTYKYMRDKIKTLATQEKKTYSSEEILEMYEKGFFDFVH